MFGLRIPDKCFLRALGKRNYEMAAKRLVKLPLKPINFPYDISRTLYECCSFTAVVYNFLKLFFPFKKYQVKCKDMRITGIMILKSTLLFFRGLMLSTNTEFGEDLIERHQTEWNIIQMLHLMYGSKNYFSWVVSNIYTFVYVDCSYWREAT